MFTGIVQAVGTVQDIHTSEPGCVITIDSPQNFLASTQPGDSIAVQGVCLTVTKINGQQFVSDVSNETLRCTTLGDKKINDRINLETALTLSSLVGGHLVSGHVDGVGQIKRVSKAGDSVQYTISAPAELAKYIAPKGSICIDGVSLTVNQVDQHEFNVNVIPHTLSHTTFDEYETNSKVNLEVDVVARYLERFQTFELS